MYKEFLLQNWAILLILIAFLILLKITVFLDGKTVKRLCALIVFIFILSIIVFFEFYLSDLGILKEWRIVFMAIRYSSTPFIIAMIQYSLVRKTRLRIFIGVAVFALINFISIPTGIVFSIGDDGSLQRGPLGYLPYIAVGAYSICLIYVLLRQSNKLATEIIPIIFLCFAFLSGLVLPFVFGKDYSRIFCTTVVIAVFVYYVFTILQTTKKDALTGLFNRQAYYSDVLENAKDINAIISIDMNGLKVINDTEGHSAGDEALSTLAMCFLRATKSGQLVYRIGGDEFVIVCMDSSEADVKALISRIEKYVSDTKYSCAIGYSYAENGSSSIEEMLIESDKVMYEAKKRHYNELGKNR